MRRLKALAATRDGFKLAEYDLELRGAGDLAGGSQWGITDFGMEALKNPRLIEAARAAAQSVLAARKDTPLTPTLLERIERTRTVHRE
jgi:ATP-dependent DNA helicase RecG